MKNKKFIVIEGLDGSGKTTQFELLKETLKDDYKFISFPDYELSSGKIIRNEYLSGNLFKTKIPEQTKKDIYAISMMYAFNRYMSFRENCLQDFNSETKIISSRYTTSNIIYMGSQLGESPIQTGDYKTWKNTIMNYADWITDLEYNKLGLPEPTSTIFYHVPIEISQKLLEERYNHNNEQKDIHERNIEYLKSCEEVALDIAREFKWTIIECTDKAGNLKSIEEIHNKTLEIINR